MNGQLKNRLKRLRNWYVVLSAKYDRGKGQFAKFNDFFQLSVMVGLGIGLWNSNFAGQKFLFWTMPQIPMNYLFWGIIGLGILYFVWGHIDKTYLHIWQVETQYNSTEANPWLQNQFAGIKKDTEEIKSLISDKKV